ncbi:MAG: hypothetical protein IPP15_22895 [Saprospiraceae bacterium]|uniref:Uncharacterized protein n=1 Tax=Candidatus Opimibacter skivensis TaxID=2982028 RepID=A0A9D7SXP9_9BACT|nr:hypothetical protein [Candidatus Opimibacter skivensis]
MKRKETSKPSSNDAAKNENNEPIGYPLYPDKDDIYKRAHEEKEIDPDAMDKIKEDPDLIDDDEVEELDFSRDVIRDDLDIPGSELDDDQEDIGNEDEENNFYSIGGDNHNDLEEDQGDDEF